MNEQLRIEAEKVLQSVVDDIDKIRIEVTKPYFKEYLDNRLYELQLNVFKALDFHAQQSKERDAFTIAFTDWVVYEACCSSATNGKSIMELLEIYKSNNLKK